MGITPSKENIKSSIIYDDQPSKKEQVYKSTYYLALPLTKEKFIEKGFKTWEEADFYRRNLFPFLTLSITDNDVCISG